jgi:hypothetical protein
LAANVVTVAKDNNAISRDLNTHIMVRVQLSDLTSESCWLLWVFSFLHLLRTWSMTCCCQRLGTMNAAYVSKSNRILWAHYFPLLKKRESQILLENEYFLFFEIQEEHAQIMFPTLSSSMEDSNVDTKYSRDFP